MPRSRTALVVAVLGSSMAFLDSTVVNVALPVMQRELDASVTIVQWIVEAYALFLAALVLVGGALGDRFGRKRVFLAGVILFAIASVGCGLAPNGQILVGVRAVQGIGAALLVPGSLALISAAFEDKEARGAAIGTWSAASAMTSALGPVAGGWVVAHGSWRWVFFFNVPLAALVVVLARGVDETRDETAKGNVDWLGAALVAAGLGMIVYALIESEHVGWSTAHGVVFFLGALTLVAFVVAEQKQSSPMVPLSLFESRAFAGTNLLTLLLYAALGGGLFFLPFNLIQVQHYSPTAAGASFLPFVLIVSAMSRWMGKLSERVGPRKLLVSGPLVAAGGFALLAVPGIGGSYWTTFFPGVLVLGIGMGITVAPLTATVMGSVDPHHAGVASGINNAVARAASLLAVAALGALLIAVFGRAIDEQLGSSHLAAVGHAQQTKLLAADFSSLDPGARAALETAFTRAYVSAFRAVMIACAGLSALAGACGLSAGGAEPRRA
jgi:EmrB/QacA subfamily drug resistance transporter